MTKDFIELLSSFQKIHNLGYIESSNKNKNNGGIILEKLLGANAGDLCYPDINGIEIKCIRKYFLANIELFSSVPDGSYIYPTQWLSKTYGYPDKDFKNQNILKGEVAFNKLTKIGLKYYFKLGIDNINQKILLKIYNSNNQLINKDIFWDFDTIQKKIEVKLSKLAIIENIKKNLNNKFFYKYDNIKLYTLKSFNIFLKLIKEGVITISFNTGIVKSGQKRGKFCDHGTAFKICKRDIEKLFDRIY